MTNLKVKPKIESEEGKLASLPRATLVERRDVTDDLMVIKLVPDGELSHKMWRLNIGDTMSVRPRGKGVFTFKENFHHHLMLSTVTGASLTISMIRHYLHENRQAHTFYVLLGASYCDQFTYDGELSELAVKYPSTIKFVSTCSRPDETRDAGWTGPKGRVNSIFE